MSAGSRPEDLRESLNRAEAIAKAVDGAIRLAEPSITNLQVAADPSGNAVISGIAPSRDAAISAEKAAGEIAGVKQLFNSLTVT